MRSDRFFDVDHILKHAFARSFLRCGAVEYILSLIVISQHAFKLCINITMELEQLVVCDLENTLGIILA